MWTAIFFDGTSIDFPASCAADALKTTQENNWDYKILTKKNEQ